MLAGLGDLYIRPDPEGYFLAPKNFGTAEYVAEKMERMRKGEWPTATAGDEMQGLDWTLKRREPGTRKPPETVCEVSFLDFAGEVYRTAFGIGEGDASLAEQVEELKRYVREADDLIVLINLRDIIAGVRDARVKEAKWVTKAILDEALAEEKGRKAPRAAIVLSQADSYAETIKSCGGALGVLEQYLPYVAAEYGWLDIFAANAVDKTALDDEGNVVPAADFTTQGLLPILKWIRGEKVSGGGLGEAALPGSDLTGGSRSCATVTGAETAADRGHKKVQLWKDGPYWAETNIGAENPWDFGYYFWWGDTVGYKYEPVNGWFNCLLKKGVWVASDGSSSGFSFNEVNTPTYGKNDSTLQCEEWITARGVLVPNHDAAHVKWGGKWRLPTEKELDNLRNKCDWIWTTMNGMNGYVICGKGGYASSSIFIPAAGSGHGTSLRQAGSCGFYWSSVPYPDPDDEYSYSWDLFFDGEGCYMCNGYGYGRDGGYPIRPVQGFTKKRTK